MKYFKQLVVSLLTGISMVALTGCGSETAGKSAVSIDGSSTVYLLSESIAEAFQKENQDVQVTIGISGTGGGFKKFAAGEIDIADASRRIKASESGLARENKVEYLELPVAYDGISIVSNKENDFIDYLSVEELKSIWQPQSGIKKWSQIRPGWPDKELHLYGPGADSGTFDYFTQAIVGKERSSRSDYTASEDDNVLLKGISADRNSLGYLGYAYYLQNKDRLRLIPVRTKGEPVAPNSESIVSGKYKPLSRHLYIYVNMNAARRRELASFVEFYLKHAGELAADTGYLPLAPSEYKSAMQRFQAEHKLLAERTDKSQKVN